MPIASPSPGDLLPRLHKITHANERVDVFVAEVSDVDESPYTVGRCAGDLASLDCVHAMCTARWRTAVGPIVADGDVDAVVEDGAKLVMRARVQEGAADRMLPVERQDRPAPPLVVVALSGLEASWHIRHGRFLSSVAFSYACNPPPLATRKWTVRYRAHNGAPRPAIVLVPDEFGPGKPSPPLPLVISPHGRGVSAAPNARLWGELPDRGGFAVICPGGMGRRLPLHSWGYRGQITDLARMHEIARRTLPWLRIDQRRIYALGGSMGGQETLLLLGQHPQLLAGAVAFDSVTNFYRRYNDFAITPGRRGLQALARFEVGGTPRTNPTGYVLRSPTHWIKEIAGSGVRLQIWWSITDQIVIDQTHQSAHFYNELRRLRPRARVEAVTGVWRHSAEMRHDTQLPDAVRWLGLLPV